LLLSLIEIEIGIETDPLARSRCIPILHHHPPASGSGFSFKLFFSKPCLPPGLPLPAAALFLIGFGYDQRDISSWA